MSISSLNRVIVTATNDDKELNGVLNHFGYGFFKSLEKENNVLSAFIKANELTLGIPYTGVIYGEPWLDDNGDHKGHPAKSLEDDDNFAANMSIGKSSGLISETDLFTCVTLCSPGELRVYDSDGQVTGLVNGVIKEEIPNSVYITESKDVIIFPSNNNYHYEVTGTDIGTYGLMITSIGDNGTITFNALDIPTSPGEVHQFEVDWNTLSQGGQGVTVQIDSNGDGTFEETITTGSTFTMPSDVSALVAVANSNILFDRRSGQYSMDMTIKNTSQETLSSPIKLIIQNIKPSISVVNADGIDNGNPYFDYSGLVGTDNNLSPGEISSVKRVIFSNPQRLRFSFDAKVIAVRSSGNPAAPSAINNSIIPFTITIPGQFALLQSYPNPFNPEVWIPYELAEPADVVISIYDTSGRLVRTLDLGHKEIDVYATRDKSAYWDGRNELGEQVSSGVYFYQIKAGDFVATRKFVMLK